MSRTRAWRRAQALRLIQRRRNLAKTLWSWSFTNDPEWITDRSVRWDKVNPFTQCSCWMCQGAWRDEYRRFDAQKARDEWESQSQDNFPDARTEDDV